jgi:coenzyme F420-0:L-glutamate ligase / coenzyme F420-1:gamma-L-glutamate ligase
LTANFIADAASLLVDTRGVVEPAKDRGAVSPAPTPTEDSFAVLVSGRRSIRRYRPEPVDEALIGRIIAQATWAPSAHNRQPWRFALIDHTKRRTLAAAMAAQLQRDRLADGDDPKVVAADVARSIARLTEAPSLVLVALTMQEMDRYPDPRRAQAEFLMAAQSTAMAAQNLMLAAHSQGLGSCVLCAPLFCPDTVVEALDLPRDWQPQCLITMGWPANTGKTASRRPLSEVLATGAARC